MSSFPGMHRAALSKQYNNAAVAGQGAESNPGEVLSIRNPEAASNPSSAAANFQRNFRAKRTTHEKQKCVADRVVSLWKQRKQEIPLEEFNLTEEQYNMLPHPWFKSVYLVLKWRTYSAHQMLDTVAEQQEHFPGEEFEAVTNVHGPIYQAHTKRNGPPTYTWGIGWHGGKKTRRRGARRGQTRRR